MPGTIQGSFGWDNAPLIAGMREAEQVTTRGASNIRSKFSAIFKRSPDVRAERALSGAFERFASGDIAGGIEQISSRMTGLGIIAGVAIGAGVAIFVKFQQQIAESNAAAKALAETLAFSGTLRGPEQMAERFKEVSKEVDTLIEKSDTLGVKMSNFFNAPGSLFGTPGKKPEDNEAKVISGLKEEASLLIKNADFRQRELGQKNRGVIYGEEQVQIAKVYQEVSLKQSAIDEELGHFKLDAIEKAKKLSAEQRKVVFDKLIPDAIKSAKSKKDTIGEEGALSIDEIYAKKAEKDRQFEATKRLANLQRGGANPDQINLLKTTGELADIKKRLAMPDLNKSSLALREQIEQRLAPGKFLGEGERKSLEDQLKTLQGAPTAETRKQLELEKTQKENALRAMKAPPKNKFAFGTIASRDWQDQNAPDFGSIAARSKETENAGAFGSLAYSAAQRGDTELKPETTLSQEIITQLTTANTTLTSLADTWVKP